MIGWINLRKTNGVAFFEKKLFCCIHFTMHKQGIQKPTHKRANTKTNTASTAPAPITAYIQSDYKTTTESIRGPKDAKDSKKTSHQKQEQSTENESQRKLQPHVLFAVNVKLSALNFEISNQITQMIMNSTSIVNAQLKSSSSSNSSTETKSLEIQQTELLQYCDLLNEFLDANVLDNLEFPQLDEIITLIKQTQLSLDAKSNKFNNNDNSDDVINFAAPSSYLNPLGGSKYAAHMQTEDSNDVILNKEISQRILKLKRDFPSWKQDFDKRIRSLIVDLFVKLQVLNQSTFVGQKKPFEKALENNTDQSKMQIFLSGMNDLLCSQIQQIQYE